MNHPSPAFRQGLQDLEPYPFVFHVQPLRPGGYADLNPEQGEGDHDSEQRTACDGRD